MPPALQHTCAPRPDAPAPSCVPGSVPRSFALETAQPLPGPVGIKMKAARFVMRGAGTLSRAGLVPREVDHFSRYSPSPLSMKQLLDFGERGRRAGWGAGAGELPELQVPVQGGMGSLLKDNWGPLSCRTPEPPRQRTLLFPPPGVFRTVCARRYRPLAAPLLLDGLSSSFRSKASIKILSAFSQHLTMN